MNKKLGTALFRFFEWELYPVIDGEASWLWAFINFLFLGTLVPATLIGLMVCAGMVMEKQEKQTKGRE